jgi:DNA-binding NtrC family response regulator
MRTLLIVEDDAVLGSVLHAAFARDWTVELAVSADDALAAFRESPPDVVLTDKNMPGMDGLGLVREIRRVDPTVGIVVMTAYGTVDSARDSMDHAVDAYIEKPFPSMQELVAELGRLRERVVQRRKAAPPAQAGSLKVGASCPSETRRLKLREFLPRADRIGWCDSVEDLARAVKAGECTATLLDCAALGLDPLEVVPLVEPKMVPCVVVAEGLSVPEVARLIDLRVKALIDRPIEDSRFGEMLHRALERIRCGTI